MSRPNKSKYKPVHPEKYVGDVNNIVARSSWERRFMIWCDRNSSVIKWSSEECIVRYYNPVKKRPARYFPDFIITVKNRDGDLKTIMIEVKPHKETQVPDKKIIKRNKKRYIREAATYAINTHKWAAARQYCASKGWEFQLVTEKELGLK